MDLTDEQWAILQPFIPEPPRRDDGRGRPWKPARDVLNSILWILRIGAPWQDMPERYPPYQTCHLSYPENCGSSARMVLLAAYRTLRSRSSKLARPYIWCLSSFKRLI
ncbi:MAG: transposase [Anaerolineales bacterium]|nr:transposase [Anaerolineales bacterium]MCB0026582.1 transposase [Anaerolineales bacterium]